MTQCGQQQRQICAEDRCKVGTLHVSRDNIMTCVTMQVVEGEPECFEKVVENGVQVPEETCSMEPTTECKNVTVRSVVNVIRREEVKQ